MNSDIQDMIQKLINQSVDEKDYKTMLYIC